MIGLRALARGCFGIGICLGAASFMTGGPMSFLDLLAAAMIAGGAVLGWE